MTESASGPVEAKAENPFDVPKGRWKAYFVLTVLAMISAFIGLALGIDLLVMIGLLAALFLAVGIAYSYMNEKGL